MKLRFLTISLCFFFFTKVNAQKNIKTNKVSIFTNGNSFVEKTFDLSPNNNKFTLSKQLVPKARMGSLIFSDKENSILSIKSYVDTIRKVKIIPADSKINYIDILVANLNKPISITTDQSTVTGELSEFIKNGPYGISHVMIKEENGYNFIRIADIKSFSFPTKPKIPSSKETISTVPYTPDPYNPRKAPDLKINIVLGFNDSKPKEIAMKYLQRGVSWRPFYFFEIDDNNNKGKLILKAEVINDSEEIANADLDLFIGTPNFVYSDYLADLVDFKHLLDPDFDAQSSGNMNHLASISVSEFKVPLTKRPYNFNKVTPNNYQEFYVYKLKNENLKKNSRAHYNLFEKTLDYKHIYECDLTGPSQQRSVYNGQKEAENTVYHSLKIKNTTGNLLGEGSISIIDNTDKTYVPLAQTKLEYTPNTAIGFIKITETHEIVISQKEEIIERGQTLFPFWGSNYHRAKIKSTIKVVNYKNEPINLIVRQDVHGNLPGNSSYEIIEKKEKYSLPNPINKVQWDLTLNANEEKEISFEYEFYSTRKY